MKILFSTLFAVSLLASGQAKAAEPESFDLDVSRVQGALDCTLTVANKSLSCKSSFTALGKTSLKMTLGDRGSMKGFVGTDSIKEGATTYVLVVAANTDKLPHSLVLVHVNAEGAAIDGGLSITRTDKVLAINIAPFHFEKSGTDAKLSLSFVAYGPASSFNPASEHDQKVLENYLIEELQPVITALLK